VGDLEAAVEDASTIVHEEVGPAGPELQALALMNLGIAESWTFRLSDSEKHLNSGLALGRQLGRPYVEVACLGALGVVANITGRLDAAEDLLRQSVAIADRVGWSTHPIVGPPLMALGLVCIDRGRNEEGAHWLERADRILAHAPEPAAAVGLRHTQGMLEYSRARFNEAIDVFRECEILASELRVPHFLGRRAHFWQLRARVRLGDLEGVRSALADAGAEADGDAEWCNIAAHLSLVEGDAAGAAAAVAPVLAGEAIPFHVNIEIESLLLDALARTQLDEPEAAERSVERVLELTEPQGRVWMALTLPGVGELLQDHPMHRTAHAAHLKTLIDLAAGAQPRSTAPLGELADPLSDRELAVLRFLPTNLSANDIGNELFVSVHTVKTHMRKLYAKLDVHTRAEAVQRGRALGLLGPARRSA
jgi:LuxR family transcriptional regulator, maltose regulon positive regulatory protein